MNIIPRYILLLALVLCFATTHAQIITLAGQWRFQIDSNDVGLKEQWFNKQLNDNIKLPGTMAENGKGNDVTLFTKWTGSIYDSSFFFRPKLAKYREPGNVKVPFWLTPVKHYVGVAWYQKDVIIPPGWDKKRVTLLLERSHIQTTAWIDDATIGKNNSLTTSHEFVLPKTLTPGKHTITIRIDNTLKDVNVGADSHSVTDQTQTNWNGIVGKILLQAGSFLHVDNVQVYPDINKKEALVKVTVANDDNKPAEGKIVLSANSFNTTIAHLIAPFSTDYKVKAHDTATFQIKLEMGDKMQLWDEFNPGLYALTATITTTGARDEKMVQFGMREIKANGTKLEVNGRPVFLRGTVNNCEFPLTGYAPMDVASWDRLFKIAKAHGLNHMRFHSWCPPEAAFIAADKAGFYLQPEGPTWPNHGTCLGDGRFIDKYLYDETNRMEKAYGNYASFCMLSGGNEPAGRNHAKYLSDFVKYWQNKDNRRVYTGASVAMSWPLYPGSDYMIKSGARGLNWNSTRPESMTDYRAALQPYNVPYITHEQGQWCVFPNFKEIKKYTGVTRAKNFELFQEDLQDQGMGDEAEQFLMASGKLQALCYKQEIEKSLRTPGLAGFQLLGLQDFPGQGTALVGVLDAFWDEKPYIDAKEWSRFCNSTVPLSRIRKFVYTNDETFNAAIELYHYGKNDLIKPVLSYTIKNEKGNILVVGKLTADKIATGSVSPVGNITFPLSSVSKASKLTLEVKVDNTSFANDWDIWVYPQQVNVAAVPVKGSNMVDGIYYTDTLDAKAEDVLNKGGKVFLNAAGKVVKGKEVVEYFTPVFWNTSWFKMRPPHTLGILVKEDHPAFNNFPTSYHSDLQWWEIVNRAQVMHLEDFPKGFRPLVQPIDTWFMNRKLALIMEASVGKGKLMVSSANLNDNNDRPVARQLLYSLQQYMQSNKFDPKDKVDIAVVRDLFISPSKDTWDSFTKDSPDELKPKK